MPVTNSTIVLLMAAMPSFIRLILTAMSLVIIA